MAVQTNNEIKGTEKEFLDLFNHLCYSRTAWQVWSDLMSAMACTIANVFETNPKRKADREKEYERCIKELGGDVEIPAKLFAIVTMALENNRGHRQKQGRGQGLHSSFGPGMRSRCNADIRCKHIQGTRDKLSGKGSFRRTGH